MRCARRRTLFHPTRRRRGFAARKVITTSQPCCSSMSEDFRSVKIRVRSGESEAEVEAAFSDIHEAIELIPEVLSKLPPPGLEARAASSRPSGEASELQLAEPPATGMSTSVEASSIPTVTIE